MRYRSGDQLTTIACLASWLVGWLAECLVGWLSDRLANFHLQEARAHTTAARVGGHCRQHGEHEPWRARNVVVCNHPAKHYQARSHQQQQTAQNTSTSKWPKAGDWLAGWLAEK
uniref:Uncharacterized protein n=1 Tax=Anopheles braziliensis TaxID=58242 RepID=A0A2M3ZLS2_9DIPT